MALAVATRLHTGAIIPFFFGGLDHRSGWVCRRGVPDGLACHEDLSIKGWEAVYSIWTLKSNDGFHDEFDMKMKWI